MPKIPLADAPSQNISGARMPYMDGGAMAAPARALMGLGAELTQQGERQMAEQRRLAEKYDAEQKRMANFNMRLSMEKLNTDQTLAYETDYNSSAPDGSNFPKLRVENFNKAYDQVRKTITDPELQAEADLLAERMRGDFVVKSVNDAGKKRVNYVTTETDRGIGDALKTGLIKDRASAEAYFENVIKPKIDAGIEDPAKREQLYGVFGKRLLDELRIVDPKSLLQRPVINGNTAQKAAALIRQHEGYRDNAYWDVNAHRVGYGSDTTTLADGTIAKVTATTVTNKADAERDLARRIGEFEADARKSVGPQWDKLNPDQQAALVSVAYNYGSLPVSVVSAIRTGDVNAIAKSVADLKANPDRRAQEASIIAGGGIVATGEEVRPVGGMWDYIQPDDLRVAQNAASTAEKERLDLGLETGSTTLEDIQNAGLNDGDTATLIGKWKTANKETLDLQELAGRLNNDPGSVTAADKPRLDKLYDRLNGDDRGALASSDDAVSSNARATMEDIWQRTGIIPTSAERSLQTMVNSGDAARMTRAFMVMDRLQRQNPEAFRSQMGETLRKNLEYWQTFKDFKSEAEIAKAITEFHDPTQEQVITLREKRAEKLLKDNYAEPSDKIDAIGADKSWFSSDVPGNADAADLMDAEWGKIFVDAYRMTGNEDEALRLTKQRFEKLWNSSEFSGGGVMRHPPENYTKQINGSHEWMTTELNRDLKELGYDLDGKSVAGPMGSVGTETEWQARLIATVNTEVDVTKGGFKPGTSPRYDVVLVNKKTGMIEVLHDYYFDPARPAGEAQRQFISNQERSNALAENVDAVRNPDGSVNMDQLNSNSFGEALPNPNASQTPFAGSNDGAAPNNRPVFSRLYEPGVSGILLRRFNERKMDGRNNEGINIKLPAGTPIKAAADGIVTAVKKNANGSVVTIKHANGLVTVYSNADTMSVKQGDKVTAGSSIGTLAAAGQGEAPQLYFEVRQNSVPIDPIEFLNKQKK